MLHGAVVAAVVAAHEQNKREELRAYREAGEFNIQVLYGYAATRPEWLGAQTGMYSQKHGLPHYHAFCRSCGAPGEPDHCSYCLTKSEQ